MTSRRTSPPSTNQVLSTVDGLVQLSFLIYGTLERRASEHDSSMIQTRLLGILRDRQPTMNELAKSLDLDKSSVTGLVDRAQRRGLVKRTPSVVDRRAVTVSLTRAGRGLVSNVAASLEADIAEIVHRLPVTARGALTRIVSRLLVAHAAEHGVDLFAPSRVASDQARSAV
jgi:MarR family transcriptional regulator, lower aerobic nicotinate degradation pathway regulator